jgi:hypothetical protein
MKHYNPFKMWGAWLGAGVGFLIGIIYYISSGMTQGSTNWDFFGIPIIIIILGFLIGWGIHSLVRKLR